MQESILPKAVVIDAVASFCSRFREIGLDDDDLNQAVVRSGQIYNERQALNHAPTPIDEKLLTPYARIELRRQRLLNVFKQRPDRTFTPREAAAFLVDRPSQIKAIMADVYNDLKNLWGRDLIERIEESPKRVFYRLKRS